MAQTYRSQHLAIMKRNEARMTELFAGLAGTATRTINRNADADGNLSRTAITTIRQELDAATVRLFLGRNRRGELAPLETLPDGTVLPLSPYARVLWEGIRAGVRVQVEREANIMRRRLPADVAAMLRRANRAPFRTPQVSEVFRPNPRARYDPPHVWVDPNGYRLSDRVWNTSAATRRRIDALLDDAIRTGRGAGPLSRELETFLLPGRTLRTKRPYGTDASYDAMRLARTEITRAAAGAAEESARLNPLVRGLKWNLSPQHRCCDVCDDRAQGGPNGDGVYPLDDLPTLPAHPHCMCYWTQELIPSDQIDAEMERLRDDIQSARAELVALVGPLLVEQFTELLLGRELETIRDAVPALAA